MILTIALSSALAATQPAPLKPETVNHKVRVDGKAYRVKVKGRTVSVYDKAFVTKRTPENGERLRQAVRQATGCEMTDPYWEDAHMTGILVCPEK